MRMLRSGFAIWLVISALLCGCQETNVSTDGSPGKGSVAELSAEIPAEILSAVKVVTDAQRGFESPEAAYEAYAKGHREADAVGQLRALTDDSQKLSAARMIFGLGMMAAFDKTLEADVRALLEKYGLGDESKLREPPPGITKASTQRERQLAMAEMISNPHAFALEAAECLKTAKNVTRRVNEYDGEILDVVITGDTATAMLKQRRGRKPIAFQKLQGGWLVEIVDAQIFGKSPGRTASGSGTVDRFGMGRNKTAPPAISTVSLTDVQNAWKLSVNYQQQTAKAALLEMADKGGLKIHEQPDFEEALQKIVDVKMDNVSVVQIIEEICRQADLHPRYKAGGVALSKGPRALPITFVGPFLLEATKTHEMLPNAFVQVEFQCFAAGIPSAMCAQLAGKYVSDEDKDDRITVAMPDLLAGDGATLDAKLSIGFPAAASQSSVHFKINLQVAKALQNVDRIAEFESRISWTFPQQVHSATFEKIAVGQSAEAGNAALTITKIRDGAQTSVEMSLEGMTHKALSATASDADGKAIPKTRISGSSYDGETATAYVQGKIVQLQVHVMEDNVRVNFPFRFPAIPLAHYADQPAELEQLTIDGETPVPIEFVRIKESNGNRSCVFHWSNRTNKDIFLVKGKIEFLDADGKVIKEQDISQEGNRILLEFEAAEETNFFGNWLPEGTESAKIKFSSMEFADTTTWTAPETQ